MQPRWRPPILRKNMSSGKAPALVSIQVGRGLAALAVVFYHVSLLFIQKANTTVFGGYARYGYMGVPFFFVLSGFIIGYAHFKDIGQPSKLRAFLYKRFVRVYPMYWALSLAFVIAALIGFGEPDFSFLPFDLIQSLILIHFTPQFSSPPLKVAWTLFFEVRFYLIFGFAIYYPKATSAFCCGWFVAIFMLTPFNALTYEWLSYWNLAFPLGLAACFILSRARSSSWSIFVISGFVLPTTIILFSSIESLHGGRSVEMLGVMVGFSLLMLGASLAERLYTVRYWSWLLLLGDASYAVYLVHSAIISVAGIVIFKYHVLRHVSAEALVIPLVLIATLIGIVVHLLLEKPLISFLRLPKLAGSTSSLR
jgi:exopolysaccharide production protein ExoZ